MGVKCPKTVTETLGTFHAERKLSIINHAGKLIPFSSYSERTLNGVSTTPAHICTITTSSARFEHFHTEKLSSDAFDVFLHKMARARDHFLQGQIKK